MASIVKGHLLRVFRNAARNNATWSTSADDCRSSSVTVKKNVPPGTKLRRYWTISAVYPGFRFAACATERKFVARMEQRVIRVNLRVHLCPRRKVAESRISLRCIRATRKSSRCACPNSDIENLESRHRQVSKSHRVLTRKCKAFDPPIGASGLDRGLVPRWSPFRGRTFFRLGSRSPDGTKFNPGFSVSTGIAPIYSAFLASLDPSRISQSLSSAALRADRGLSRARTRFQAFNQPRSLRGL